MRERIGLGQVDHGILEEGNNLEKENRHKNRNTMARERLEKIYLLNRRKKLGIL